MRISTFKEDPGYAPDKVGAKVFFEGAEVLHVFTADEERRLIVQADLDDNGRVQIDEARQQVKTITRYGHVRIELRA